MSFFEFSTSYRTHYFVQKGHQQIHKSSNFTQFLSLFLLKKWLWSSWGQRFQHQGAASCPCCSVASKHTQCCSLCRGRSPSGIRVTTYCHRQCCGSGSGVFLTPRSQTHIFESILKIVWVKTSTIL